MRGDDAYSPATVCLRQRHHAAIYMTAPRDLMAAAYFRAVVARSMR